MSAQTKSKLTPSQIIAAAELLKSRPAVIEGTRVIPNTAARNAWYDEVKGVMNRLDVRAVDEFCDRAGVPD